MTNIEWTHIPGYVGKSWNPVTGCQKIASGCKNCYAEALAHRFWGDRKFTDVQTHADRLDQPLRARKPTCWFVNSMSDLFHDAVPFEFIAAVYGVMAACPQHKFIVLTKRPQRMREFFEWVLNECVSSYEDGITEADLYARCALRHPGFQKAVDHNIYENFPPEHPLPNVWHGVSVAEQKDADKNIPILLQVPSAIRFVSAEPLIGPVTLATPMENWLDGWTTVEGTETGSDDDGNPYSYPVPEQQQTERLDWVIVGGESGPGARPCDVAWIRSIVEQCKAVGVPCFVKQLGATVYSQETWCAPGFPAFISLAPVSGPPFRVCIGPKGNDPERWPADLRVRQFPAPRNAEGPEVARA